MTYNDPGALADTDAALRPPPRTLQLLLRAALADDGHGGPWLSLQRNSGSDRAQLLRHHIHTSPVMWWSERHMIMMSGTDALAFAAREQWDDVISARACDLVRLSAYAVTASRAAYWHTSYSSWLRAEVADRQSQRWAAGQAARQKAADAIRRAEAERWLREHTA